MEQQSNLVEYELPDRQMITLDRKEIKHYLLTGGQGPDRDKDLGLLQAIPSLISDNINSCDVDIKKELYSNILMAGTVQLI